MRSKDIVDDGEDRKPEDEMRRKRETKRKISESGRC